MALSCADLRRMLDEGTSLEAAGAREHLRACAACRRAAERWGAVMAELRGCGDTELPAFLHARVMAHVRAAGRRSRRPLLRRVWWVPALASALLVGVIGVWRSPLRPPPDPSRPSDGLRGPTPAPAEEAPQAEPAHTPARTPPLPQDASAGALRGGAAPQNGTVACAVVASDGTARRRVVDVAEPWAPPAGVTWTVIVAPSGTVQPEAVGSDAAVPDVPLESLEILASLDLEPGRYALARVSPPAR